MVAILMMSVGVSDAFRLLSAEPLLSFVKFATVWQRQLNSQDSRLCLTAMFFIFSRDLLFLQIVERTRFGMLSHWGCT